MRVARWFVFPLSPIGLSVSNKASTSGCQPPVHNVSAARLLPTAPPVERRAFQADGLFRSLFINLAIFSLFRRHHLSLSPGNMSYQPSPVNDFWQLGALQGISH